MTEAGPLDLIDTTGEASDLEDRLDISLPGASRGDLSKRKTKPEIRVSSIRFLQLVSHSVLLVRKDYSYIHKMIPYYLIH